MIDAVAKRYASALADVTLAEFSADRAKADLRSFVDAFYEAADLRHFLDSPAVGRDVKHKVLTELMARMRLDTSVHNFILLIVDHRRTESLRDMLQAYQEELNARLGIAEAEITSARPLSASEKDQLTAALARRTGKKIEPHFSEDKSLLGGAVVRVGSTVYDGSVREQLVRMRQQLETE